MRTKFQKEIPNRSNVDWVGDQGKPFGVSQVKIRGESAPD